MTPGQAARRLLGSRFQVFGEAYRRIFVDMEKVADFMAGRIPAGAHVLDVGGGDGLAVNMLLARRPDIRVTMTDIAPQIGGFISQANQSRVTLAPCTPASAVTGAFDVMTLTDVVHHVPVGQRTAFCSTLAQTAARTRCRSILIKDIQPGSWRARLALWADHFITGDRQVVLVAADHLELPGFTRGETAMPDFPNYCVVFTPNRSDGD